VVGGIARGCELAGCALIGGETAEMPDMYPPGEYDLAGFTVGAVEKDGMLTGESIVAGDAILGVASSGPHSNGYSLIRRILERAGITPDNGGLDLDLGGTKLADALMAPTTIYVKPMLELLGASASPSQDPAHPRADSSKIPVHGMAHITGGGLKENIIRVVPDGLGLALDAAAIKLPPVFDWLQREGNVAREEMWRTFNCGVGFTVILPHDAVDAASALLARHGLASAVIGEVVKAQGDERVRIG
jgi:phosphoribosylformylglycinamidine cyclo-ligase